MKRVGAAVATVALAAAGIVGAAPAVSADTPGCVDNWEFNHVYIGDDKWTAERRYDTEGTVGYQDRHTMFKRYDHCGRYWSVVRLKYEWTGSRWLIINGHRSR